MNAFLDELKRRATQGFLRTIILPESDDERVVAAAKILAKEKILTPLLVTTPDKASRFEGENFEHVAIDENLASELAALLREVRASKKGTPDELTEEKAIEMAHTPLVYGMYLLRIGRGDGLVAGAAATTRDVIRVALWIVGKADGIQTVSSSFYIHVPSFRNGSDEVLTFADCGVVPEPTSEQLADIALAAADARTSIVGDEPRVAMLSYSTKGSGGESESILKVRRALDIIRTKRPELIVDGEMQLDAALVQSIARRKSPGGAIQGDANVLVFPSLDAANIGYKLVATLQPQSFALGPILQGMKLPVSDLSRGATVDDIVRTATIVAAQVKQQKS